tara:strand:+ start:1299 stop:1853 length:555 start_codon:yes stop_codon:yes gene_type:complete
MKTLKPLSFEEANTNSQEIFKVVKGKVGMIPNLYAAMGVSDKLLGGFLSFTETLKSGELSGKEYEVVALATSQVNECEYCLSAHTTIGKMNGLSEIDTLEIRSNTIENKKLNALATFASELADKKGKASDYTINKFFEAGYSKAAFAEVLGIVSLTIMTNTVYHNGGFEIDFPAAQSIVAHPLV